MATKNKLDSVVITGTGIISAMGMNGAETLDAFKQHKSGIHPIKHLKTRHEDVFPCGEVKASNADLAQLTGLADNLSRSIYLSYHAAKEALASVPFSRLADLRVGFISASTVGGMDRTEQYFASALVDPQSGDVRDTRHHDCGKPTDYVFRKLGLKGFVSTISTACSSSANAIMLASRLLKSDRLDVVIAGGVDALTRFTLNGFNSLMIVDQKQCEPLDRDRRGLNLGEGAAYVVLMKKETALQLEQTPISALAGFANTNDTFHQTALSEQGNGPYAAMTNALQMASLQPGDISYINMHGTGTQNNDLAEGNAIRRIFHPDYPPLSSTKSFTGHTLAASGGIEGVLSVLAIQHGIIFPNYSFQEPVDGLDIRPETSIQTGQTIRHVLSNSFGFGGNCTSLIFSAS